MTQEEVSRTALQMFIDTLDLRDSHSNIHFQANIHFKTKQNNKMVNCNVRITLDYPSFGEVVVETDLPNELYPCITDVRFQKFEFINSQYILITGFHKYNPSIGNYSVQIQPV